MYLRLHPEWDRFLLYTPLFLCGQLMYKSIQIGTTGPTGPTGAGSTVIASN
ncbi:hypothetical protein [Bacillus cereus]|uniref:hypothetical protein n=1 Tax=Bacillus cereus TaxID=1396 RepID=UPI0015CF742B|nr:hypothetical protein [Bacillus cereus]